MIIPGAIEEYVSARLAVPPLFDVDAGKLSFGIHRIDRGDIPFTADGNVKRSGGWPLRQVEDGDPLKLGRTRAKVYSQVVGLFLKYDRHHAVSACRADAGRREVTGIDNNGSFADRAGCVVKYRALSPPTGSRRCFHTRQSGLTGCQRPPHQCRRCFRCCYTVSADLPSSRPNR